MPLLMVPICGETLQLTAVFVVPVTLDANGTDCPAESEAVEGDSETLMTGAGGTSEMLAVAVLAEFATLVAVTVTTSAAEMLVGAV